MKYVIVGDLHVSEHLGYYHIIKDGRESEKQEVLDFIVKTFEDNDCDGVIFLGDQFDKKNNSSSVIREFTKFIERFGDKQVFMIAGNHELSPSGDSALDYLKEISGKNWNIITKDIVCIDKMVFCPYMYKSQLDALDDEDATKKVWEKLESFPRGLPLFTHFSISDTLTATGQNTNFFNEVVLDKKRLKHFSKTFGGHIHQTNISEDVIVAGSIFNQEVGEHGKNIFIFDTDTNNVSTIHLPGRGIYKLENPTTEDIVNIDKQNIVKAYITDRKIDVESVKDLLKKFDGYVIVEQYPNKRRKVTYRDELMDLSIDNLLIMYANQKKIDVKQLISSWNKIK